jgi:hypothetical protein
VFTISVNRPRTSLNACSSSVRSSTRLKRVLKLLIVS